MANFKWAALVAFTVVADEVNGRVNANMRMMGYGPEDQMREDNKKQQSQAQENPKLFGAEQNKIANDAGGLMDQGSQVIGDAESTMGKEKTKLEKFQKKSNSEINKMTAQTLSNTAATEGFQGNLETEKDDLESDWDDGAEGAMSGMEDQAETATANAGAGAERAVELSNQVTEDASSDYESFGQEIGESVQEQSDGIEEAIAGVEETIDEQNEATKTLKDTQTDTVKLMQSSQKDAKKIEGKISGKVEKQADSILKNEEGAVKTIKGTANEFKKSLTGEMNSVKKTVGGEIGDIEKQFEVTMKGLNQQAKDEESGAAASRNEAATEAGKYFDANEKEQEGMAAGIEKEEATSSALEEKAKKMNDDMTDGLKKMQDAQGKALRQQLAANTYDLQDMQTQVGKALDDTKETVQNSLDDTEASNHAEADKNMGMIETMINNGAKNVDNGVDRVGQEVEDLDAKVEETAQRAETAVSTTGQIESNIKRKTSEVNETINKISEATQEDVAKVYDFTKDEVAASATGVTTFLEDAKQKAKGDLAAFETASASQIQSTATSTEQIVEETKRTLALENRKAEDNIVALTDVANQQSKQNQNIAEQIPGVREKIQEAFDESEDYAEQVNKQIQAKKDELIHEVGEGSKTLQENTAAKIEDVASGVHHELDGMNAKTQKEIQSLLAAAQEMKSDSEKSQTQSDQMLQNLYLDIKKTENTGKNVGVKADEYTQSISNGIHGLKEQLGDADKGQARKTQTAELAMKKTVDDTTREYTAQAIEQIDTVMSEEKKKIGTYVKDLLNKVGAEKQDTDQFVQGAQAKLGATESDVDGLKTVLDQNIAAAQAKQNSLMGKLQGYAVQQEAMRASAEAAVNTQRDDLEDRRKTLEGTLDQRVAAMEATQEDYLRSSQGQLNKAFKDEQDREAVQNENVKSYVGNFGDRMDGVTNRMGQMVEKTENSEKKFEDTANGAERELQKDVGELGADITMSDDRVGKSIQDEEKDVAGKMDGGLTQLEGTAGKLSAVKGAADGEVNQLETEMNDELAYQKQLGAAKSNELERALEHTSANAVDLVNEFKEDTAGARDELKNTEGRLNEVIGSSMNQMANFKTRLVEIQRSREKDSIDLHNQISQSKVDMADEISQAVDVMKNMKTNADQTYTEMEQEQKNFDRMIINASMISSDHDDGAIGQLADQMYSMNSVHERLMEWWKNFKHMTKAWRYHVEHRMDEMKQSIGGEDDMIEKSRLANENAQQKGLKNLQSGVEHEVVKASQKEAGQIGGVVYTVEGEMNDLQTAAKHSEEEKAAEMRAIRSKINNAEEMSGQDIAEMNSAGEALNEKSNDFSVAVNAADGTIAQELMFPTLEMQEGSKAQQNVKAQMDLQSKIQHLSQVAASLLQTGGKDHGEAIEASAIRKLNAQLRNENTELEKEDAYLEHRVDTLSQKLKDLGITLD